MRFDQAEVSRDPNPTQPKEKPMELKIVSTVPNRSGAHVNVVEENGPESLGWRCTGCNDRNCGGGYDFQITQQAQDHANTCSFLPPQN